jgi:hypothetical protein
VDENSPAGTLVGTLSAADPDAGDTLNYSIIGGNPGGAFSLNAATGRVLVANPAALDFETNPSITLAVRVTDSGLPAFSDTANVTIQLNDLVEAVPPPPPPPPPPGPGGGGGTGGGDGGGGGTGAVTPEPVSAAEDENKSPSDDPKADKPDEPVDKPTRTALRSGGIPGHDVYRHQPHAVEQPGGGGRPGR